MGIMMVWVGVLRGEGEGEGWVGKMEGMELRGKVVEGMGLSGKNGG